MSEPYITVNKAAGRVTLSVEGIQLAESQQALILREGSYPPVLYLPKADVAMDRFSRTDKVTHCPHKGDATHWAADLETRTVDVAAWSYEAPDKPAAEPISGYLGFYLKNLGPDAAFEGPGVPV